MSLWAPANCSRRKWNRCWDGFCWTAFWWSNRFLPSLGMWFIRDTNIVIWVCVYWGGGWEVLGWGCALFVWKLDWILCLILTRFPIRLLALSFWVRLSLCNLGWPGTWYGHQTGFRLTETHLPQPPQRCHQRCVPPHPAIFSRGLDISVFSCGKTKQNKTRQMSPDYFRLVPAWLLELRKKSK